MYLDAIAAVESHWAEIRDAQTKVRSMRVIEKYRYCLAIDDMV